MELEAMWMSGCDPENRWVVRPRGTLGTIGSYPYLWSAIYVEARSAREAVEKAAIEALSQKLWSEKIANKAGILSSVIGKLMTHKEIAMAQIAELDAIQKSKE